MTNVSKILIEAAELGAGVLARPRDCGRELDQRIEAVARAMPSDGPGDLLRFCDRAAPMLLQALEHVSFFRSVNLQGDCGAEVAFWEGLAGQLIAMVRHDARRAMVVEAEILRG